MGSDAAVANKSDKIDMVKIHEQWVDAVREAVHRAGMCDVSSDAVGRLMLAMSDEDNEDGSACVALRRSSRPTHPPELFTKSEHHQRNLAAALKNERASVRSRAWRLLQGRTPPHSDR